MRFEDKLKIFFVGIGGIGISGLARILRARGNQVSGSDIADSDMTDELKKEGISVVRGHQPENLPDNTDLLIYSNAVPKSNPERARAATVKIRELSYPEAVGELLQGYEKVIAVAGTNGKTTTTAMVGVILERAGLDPTVLVGSKVLAWGSNARVGGSKFFVLEADEYRRAFLNYPADVAVVTNIAVDHLDYYQDLADIKKAFLEFACKIRPGGILVRNLDDENSHSVADRYREDYHGKVADFSINHQKSFDLRVPGDFNQANAQAAAMACSEFKISSETIKHALENFTGTWRRFESVGKIGECEIISDYAHHPDGLRVTLAAATEKYKSKNILAVFQPHQHNRTKTLFKDFVSALCASQIRNFIITEIFDVAGREETELEISSQDLVRELEKCGKNVAYAHDLADCELQVRSKASIYDVVIFLGAGDIYKVADKLVLANPG